MATNYAGYLAGFGAGITLCAGIGYLLYTRARRRSNDEVEDSPAVQELRRAAREAAKTVRRASRAVRREVKIAAEDVGTTARRTGRHLRNEITAENEPAGAV